MKPAIKSKVKIVLLVLGILLLGVTALVIHTWKTVEKEITSEPNSEEKKPLLFGGESVNVLVIGSDQRDDEISRSDTLQVYHFNQSNNIVSMLSIPRDTYVNIPGHGMDKINHAYAYGGVELCKRTVSEFLDVPIDYTVEMNFVGFKNIIDKVGGVTIDVEKDCTRDGVTIKKGVQRLNGELALIYVRDRWDPMGDIERVKRQQKFMRALAKEVKEYEPKYKLIPEIPGVYKNVRTDISLEEVMQMYFLVPNITFNKSELDFVPGWFYNRNGISYWKPDVKETEALVNRLLKSDGVAEEGLAANAEPASAPGE